MLRHAQGVVIKTNVLVVIFRRLRVDTPLFGFVQRRQKRIITSPSHPGRLRKLLGTRLRQSHKLGSNIFATVVNQSETAVRG